MDLAVAIVASLGVAAALGTVVFLLGRRLRLVRQLAFPLYVGTLAAALKIFSLLEPADYPAVDRVLWGLLLFLISVSLLRVAALFVFDIYMSTLRGVRMPPLLGTVVVWGLYVLVAVIILPLAFPGINLGPILASGAVTSLVLGLALQPILGNFFAGVAISLEKPFRINDWILYNGTEARVVAINWRTTHLRNRDNDSLVVPNARIADAEIVNFYYPHPLHLERVNVGIHYRTPPYRAKRALLLAASRVDGILEKPSPEVFVVEFGDSSITYEVRVWLEDIAARPRVESELRSEIWEELKRWDITIPFPIRTLEIEPKARQLEVLEGGKVEKPDEEPRGRLFVVSGPEEGRVFPLGPEPVSAGRSSQCDLVLSTPKASKEHFRIEWAEGGYRLTDCQSQFGTLVNGERVDSHNLQHLDRITVDDTLIIFEDHDT
jgi:small-conductance mechanosensitive channel